MSALEQTIIEKIRKLDETQQQKILAYIQNVEEKEDVEDFDFDSWTKQVEQFQAELRAKYGEDHVFGTLDLLDELREEASWPRIS